MQAVEFGTYVDNGIIEIPMEYRNDYSHDVRVILLKDNADKADKEPSIRERIASAERLLELPLETPCRLTTLKTNGWQGNESIAGYQCPD